MLTPCGPILKPGDRSGGDTRFAGPRTPQMILAGRRINDGMAAYIANDVIKTMLKRKQSIDSARVLVMGFTFKEDVPDTFNTKVADLVRTLRDFVTEVVITIPWPKRSSPITYMDSPCRTICRKARSTPSFLR